MFQKNESGGKKRISKGKIRDRHSDELSFGSVREIKR